MSGTAAVKPVVATVLEELPRTLYRLELKTGGRILGHVVGNVKRNFVRLLPGDLVQVEISPHDATRGRIMRRLTGSERS